MSRGNRPPTCAEEQNDLSCDEIKRQCNQCFWVQHSGKWTVFLLWPFFNILCCRPFPAAWTPWLFRWTLPATTWAVCAACPRCSGSCYCYLCRPWQHTPHHWYSARWRQEPSTETRTTLGCQTTIIIKKNGQPASFITVHCCRMCLCLRASSFEDLSVYSPVFSCLSFILLSSPFFPASALSFTCTTPLSADVLRLVFNSDSSHVMTQLSPFYMFT